MLRHRLVIITAAVEAIKGPGIAHLGVIDRRIERLVLGGGFVVKVGSRLVPWRLTSDRLGKEIAIILGGEVVTLHKIQDRIKDGNVQITSCAAGAAKYLLEQLRAHQKTK